MRSLAQKLERACAHDDDIALVRHAMCYSAPFVEDALADCREHDCDEVTVIPLYPQSAFSTTMAVKDKVNPGDRGSRLDAGATLRGELP